MGVGAPYTSVGTAWNLPAGKLLNVRSQKPPTRLPVFQSAPPPLRRTALRSGWRLAKAGQLRLPVCVGGATHLRGSCLGSPQRAGMRVRTPCRGVSGGPTPACAGFPRRCPGARSVVGKPTENACGMCCWFDPTAILRVLAGLSSGLVRIPWAHVTGAQRTLRTGTPRGGEGRRGLAKLALLIPQN